MRHLFAFSLLSLLVLAACGPGDKMKYVCSLQWTCNEVTEERIENYCLEDDNPKLCEELLQDLDVSCEGNHMAINQNCVCEGVTAHSCPAERN